MAQLTWYPQVDAWLAAARALAPAIAEQDAPIALAATAAGHCPVCDRDTVFHNDVMFGGRRNLREGFRCAHCRLTARQRLMLVALCAEAARLGAQRGALLEQTSRLYRLAHAALPWLVGSEYLGEARTGGKRYWWSARGLRWYRVRHESITALSFADGSLDLLAHSDVLEHVYDLDLALRESVRVLRPGGAMLFTVPFFPDRAHSLLRGRPLPDGGLEHFEAPEYHGDGVNGAGIYTFHSLGADFIERLRAAGFAQAELGLCHAPGEGLAAADPAAPSPWLGLPLMFRATR